MGGFVTYSHTQETAADTWVVNHKLGVHPIVDVSVDIEGTLTKIIPATVEVISENTVRITFTKAFTGVARFI